jgi:hypothetical protein
MSEEVQDMGVIKQGVGTCHLGQRWNFPCRHLENGTTILAKYCVALFDTPKQQLVSNIGASFQEKNLVLLLTRRPLCTRPFWATTPFLTSRHLKGRKLSSNGEVTLAVYGWFAAQ